MYSASDILAFSNVVRENGVGVIFFLPVTNGVVPDGMAVVWLIVNLGGGQKSRIFWNGKSRIFWNTPYVAL